MERALDRGRAGLVRPDVQQARARRQEQATFRSDTPPPLDASVPAGFGPAPARTRHRRASGHRVLRAGVCGWVCGWPSSKYDRNVTGFRISALLVVAGVVGVAAVAAGSPAGSVAGPASASGSSPTVTTLTPTSSTF